MVCHSPYSLLEANQSNNTEDKHPIASVAEVVEAYQPEVQDEADEKPYGDCPLEQAPNLDHSIAVVLPRSEEERAIAAGHKIQSSAVVVVEVGKTCMRVALLKGKGMNSMVTV